jgi:hypothetical protein
MTYCHICHNKTSSTVTLKEPRYFWGEQRVCPDCFQHWVTGDTDYLDKKAIDKIFTDISSVNGGESKTG